MYERPDGYIGRCDRTVMPGDMAVMPSGRGDSLLIGQVLHLRMPILRTVRLV